MVEELHESESGDTVSHSLWYCNDVIFSSVKDNPN